MTWAIPERYGGMTAALLHRSRAFVTESGASVDVITFDPRLDVPATVAALRRRGELIDGIALHNIYDDFRHRLDPAADVAVPPARYATTAPDWVRNGAAALRVWRDGVHTLRREHRRADGTLAVLDEHRRSSGPRRLITAFDADGTPTGQWQDAWAFYAAWLDELIAGEQAYAIVDSKTVAPFMQAYRRGHVVTIHAVHGSHLHDGEPSRLNRVRRPVLENLHEWDAVVFLTARQRDDVVALLGDSGNLEVIPNGIAVPRDVGSDDRDPAGGAIVANLTSRKRIDHALDIIAAVRAAGAPVTARIVGDGPDRAELESRARTLGLADAVRFTGYLDQAADAFAAASWTLLTSTSEGAPLTLVEAMARGCIPIAYDIRYGPADTIEHGRAGFVVPDADIDAAASALLRLCTATGADLRVLRSAARTAASGHVDPDVVARWAQVQRRARRRHDDRAAARPRVGRVRVRRLRDRLRVSAIVIGLPQRGGVWMQVLSGGGRPPARVAMRRFGPYVVGRLDRRRTAFLGRKEVVVRIIVQAGTAQIPLDPGVQRVDPRPLPRRAWHRLRRTVGSVRTRR